MISKEEIVEFIDVIIGMTSMKPVLWYMYDLTCLVLKYDNNDDIKMICDKLKGTYDVCILRDNELIIKVR